MLGLGRGGANAGNALTVALVCTSCGEAVEDEADWDDESGMCMACFEGSDGPTYCCGMIYEDGETVCRSCGEPL